MNWMQMKFKTFIWPDNPVELRVENSRNVRETVIPMAASQSRDVGLLGRRVSGKGFFAGTDCMETFLRLQVVFYEGESGSLQLPGQAPFEAIMDSLRFVAEAGENLVEYSFSFKETGAAGIKSGGAILAAEAGESLWDCAWRCGKPVGELVRANPHIRDIGLLAEDERVVIP